MWGAISPSPPPFPVLTSSASPSLAACARRGPCCASLGAVLCPVAGQPGPPGVPVTAPVALECGPGSGVQDGAIVGGRAG